MTCSPERSEALAALAAGRLDAARALELLEHVERCAACSRELDAVAAIVAGTAPAAAPAAAQPGRRRSALPRLSVAIAAAASVLFLLGLGLLWRGSGAAPDEIAALATTTPLPASGALLRSPSDPPSGSGGATWEQAMHAYAAGDFAAAAEGLDALAASGDERPLVFLYLGVARLQLAESAAAVSALERAVRDGAGLLRERALWYLGNAHLVAGDAARARETFERLEAVGGEYEVNAQQVLEALDAHDEGARR